MRELIGKKRGQVTIFVIIAVLVVVGVILFFAVRGDFSGERMPEGFEPVYNSFQSCIKGNTQEGINILERQGGHIYLPEYQDTIGPFSSWLYFSGISIPYWSYTQGGINFEQVPSKEDMEKELGNYVQNNIQDCSLQEYEDQGFYIEKGQNPEADVNIEDERVRVDLDMEFLIRKGNQTSTSSNHEVSVNSELGSLYGSARKVYEKEKQERFLENYGIDILRLYAPVDGFELQCSPLVWNADNVFGDLENALETNTMALSSGGKYQNREDYFNLDLGIDNNARFLNSQDWEHSFEVVPSEGNKLISEPVGNNKALGALGFCYNTYHFVYDMKYPVLVQVYSSQGEETFQFPLGVVIRGNKPREGLNGTAEDVEAPEICDDRNTNMTIGTYDREGEPVDSRISIDCLNTKCSLGDTGGDGVLNTQVPQCANAQIVADSEGFKSSETTYSTIQGGRIDSYLDPLHKLDLRVLMNKRDIGSYSEEEVSRTVVSFDSEDHSKTVVYPQEKEISLAEGQYSIEVLVYGNSSMSLDQSTQEDPMEYCLDVSDSIAGSVVPGQKCFEVDSPEIINSNALIGGGKKDHYFSNSELEEAEKINLEIDKFEKPDSLGKLQENHELAENKNAEVNLV